MPHPHDTGEITGNDGLAKKVLSRTLQTSRPPQKLILANVFAGLDNLGTWSDLDKCSGLVDDQRVHFLESLNRFRILISTPACASRLTAR